VYGIGPQRSATGSASARSGRRASSPTSCGPFQAETILRFVELADAAPEELTTIPNVMPMPPMPFVPEEHHGELVIMARMCYAGDAGSSREVLKPFRELAEPFADLLREMPYPEIYPPDDPDYRPVAVSTTMFVDAIDRAAAEAMIERVGAEAPAFRVVQIRPLGGAVARVPNDATAYPHRDRPYMLNVAALLGPDDDRAAATVWVDGMAAAIQRGPVAAYVNFVGDEGAARVRDAYPHGAWERLLEIKRRYDPTNLFRLNQNVWEEAGA
jgi:hypothetical protein